MQQRQSIFKRLNCKWTKRLQLHAEFENTCAANTRNTTEQRNAQEGAGGQSVWMFLGDVKK